MRTRLSLQGITSSHPGRIVFRGPDLAVRPGERLGVIGWNGAGKAT